MTETKKPVEAKPEAKAKTTTGLTPQIAARAYELREQEGRRDGQSVLNSNKAEREIPEAELKPEYANQKS